MGFAIAVAGMLLASLGLLMVAWRMAIGFATIEAYVLATAVTLILIGIAIGFVRNDL